MADNVTLNSGTGGSTLATDDVTDAGGAHYQRVKLTDGTANSTTHIHAGDGTAANALRVTVASDSSALSVDDGAGSLTVDNTNIDNLHSADFDTGAGTDTTTAIGIAVAASGGAAVVTGDVTNGLDVDVTRVSGTVTVDGSGVTQPVSGTVTANAGTGTFTVDGSGVTQPVSGTVTSNAGTGTFTVGGVAAENAAVSGNPNLVGGRYDLTPRTLGDGDVGAIALDADGAVQVSDGGNTLTVDGTVNAAQSGTWNVTNVSGTVSLPTGAATAANQSTGNTTLSNIQTAVQLIDNPIVAHDAAASGSTGVNMAGAIASNNIEGRTQVANADATRIVADLNGCIVTRPHTTLEEIITERVSDTAGTSTAFTNFAAGGAGIHNYITTISIMNTSATDGYVDFRDGTAGSIIFTAPAPATGGSVINLPVPLKGAANTALAYDVSGALSTVYISVVGFQAQG